MDADALLGIHRPDLAELKEVKVKLPVNQLLRLHLLKMTSARTFSEIVAAALDDYFERQPRQAGAAPPAEAAPAP